MNATTHTTASGTTLVVGATGKTGRRVAGRLQERGRPVRAASRTSATPFDWEDRATWAPALDGVAAAYVTYYPDLAAPGAAAAVGAFAGLAAERGVRRLVLLSGRGEPEAQEAERALQAAGTEWTIVRCSWFAQNFSENFMLDALLAGEVALPVDGVAEPFVDLEDVADVAVAALTDDRHVGQVYELTGPRALRFDEAVDEIARAIDRSLRYVPIELAQFVGGLREQQIPEDLTSLLAYLFGEVLDGRNEATADGVRRALGREPRTFADYVTRTAASGVWKAQS